MNRRNEEQGRQNATRQYLTFRMGEDIYALDILRVREIRGWSDPREILNVPAYIKGVIDFRGGIVPLIDLRERFRLGKVEYDRETVVILLSVIVNGDQDNIGGEEHTMGIIVDRVFDVMDVTLEEIKAKPPLGSKLDTHYLEGLVNREEGMVLLLHVDHLLDPETFQLVEGVAPHER